MSRTFHAPADTVGQHLKEDFMPEYGVKAPTLAKKLGVPRARIVRLRAGSPVMAIWRCALVRSWNETRDWEKPSDHVPVTLKLG